MPKRTNHFQQLIHAIHLQLDNNAKITESKFLYDLRTGDEREVDIVIEVENPLYPIIIGVECNGKGRIATVEWVEQMIGKHLDLPTNRLILVSKAGFSPKAIRKAKGYNIETLSLTEAIAVDWTQVVGKLTQVRIALPKIEVKHIAIFPALDASSVDVDVQLYTNPGTPQDSLLEIAFAACQELRIVEFIFKNFNEPGTHSFGFDYNVPSGSYILDKSGIKHTVEKLRIAVVVHMDERIPVNLQHGMFKNIQVAYGTLEKDNLQGLLTIVEAPGKPLSADLRLSPNTKKQ